MADNDPPLFAPTARALALALSYVTRRDLRVDVRGRPPAPALIGASGAEHNPPDVVRELLRAHTSYLVNAHSAAARWHTKGGGPAHWPYYCTACRGLLLRTKQRAAARCYCGGTELRLIHVPWYGANSHNRPAPVTRTHHPEELSTAPPTTESSYPQPTLELSTGSPQPGDNPRVGPDSPPTRSTDETQK